MVCYTPAMHFHRHTWLLPLFAVALAVQSLFFAAPVGLFAQATEQSKLSINCEDEVTVKSGEIFTLTCQVSDRTSYDLEGYRVQAGTDFPLGRSWDLRVYDRELRFVGDGMYILAVRMRAHRSSALNVNASVHYRSSPVARDETSELVNIRVRHHPIYYVGIALLWLQAAVIVVALLGAVAAAIIDLSHSGRKGADRVRSAIRSAGHAVLVLLPWVYFFYRATGRPLPTELMRRGYVLFYGFWVVTYVAQFLVLAIFAVIDAQILEGQDNNWIFLPQSCLLVVIPSIVAIAVLVIWMSAHSLSWLRAAHAPGQQSADVFSDDWIRREYYTPLMRALMTWSWAWLGFFGIYSYLE